jgi:hypothetical protein
MIFTLFICSRKLGSAKLGCHMVASIHIKCTESCQLGKLFGRARSLVCMHDSLFFIVYVFL